MGGRVGRREGLTHDIMRCMTDKRVFHTDSGTSSKKQSTPGGTTEAILYASSSSSSHTHTQTHTHARTEFCFSRIIFLLKNKPGERI